jgi:murein DD-endopeptidase MepM/ murein hydrolase activator NlpD
MNRIAVAPGKLVHQAEVIGYVGSSGIDRDFEVLKNGRAVNPMGVKLDGGPGHLQGEKLHQFEDTLRAVLTGGEGQG